MTNTANRASAFDRALQGGLGGGIVGLFLLGIGAVRILVALMSGASFPDAMPSLGSVVLFALMYCGGFALAGFVLGGLLPMR